MWLEMYHIPWSLVSLKQAWDIEHNSKNAGTKSLPQISLQTQQARKDNILGANFKEWIADSELDI